MPAKYDYAQNREYETETAIVSPLLCDTLLPRDHIESQLRNLFYRVGKVVITDELKRLNQDEPPQESAGGNENQL